MSASAEGLLSYVDASPSPFHCVAESRRLLEQAGFSSLDERSAWSSGQPGDKRFVERNGTLVAWVVGQKPPAEAGFRIVGAHTDSPNLRLKPQAEKSVEGYRQWGVEVYGGVLLHTWFDRDLGLSGRAWVRTDEGVEQRLVRVDRPIARVADLAIHLNREVRTKGFNPNEQKELPPIVGLGDKDAPSVLERLLREALACEPEQVLGWDLMLHDCQPSVLGGMDAEFVFAPRMDNQASCYTAIQGLLGAQVGDPTAVIALFDHEEVGSRSAHGADGALLEACLRRIEQGSSGRGGFERAAANSYMVSADMAHGVHPNYADRHDGNHKPAINGGPVIKANANQRYATDGETAARFRRACLDVEVPVQDFINRTDLACGSTIGPISSANLGIRTVDVGCAMLSMHSVREHAGAADVELMARVKARILSGQA